MGYDLNQHWRRKKLERARARADGKIIITRNGRRYQVVTPYDEDFREGMIELGARWRERSGCWSIAVVSRRLLKELIERCFGAEKVPEWMLKP